MALIYKAELVPSKVELLNAWLPAQPWFPRGAGAVESLGAYRFDDPGGEVGIETIVARAGDGSLIQVPVTYRAAPLAEAADGLIGTLQHSVLGERWVYDGCADPVYATALATAIVTGGTEAPLEVVTDDGLALRPPTTRVTGSGQPGLNLPPLDGLSRSDDARATTMRAGELELVLLRVLDAAGRTEGELTLTGTWPGRDEPTLLALVRR
jgi:hypothetical protein